MSRRDDFTRAARSLAVARHQERRDNFYIPRGERFRQRPFNEQTDVILFIFGYLEEDWHGWQEPLSHFANFFASQSIFLDFAYIH